MTQTVDSNHNSFNSFDKVWCETLSVHKTIAFHGWRGVSERALLFFISSEQSL